MMYEHDTVILWFGAHEEQFDVKFAERPGIFVPCNRIADVLTQILHKPISLQTTQYPSVFPYWNTAHILCVAHTKFDQQSFDVVWDGQLIIIPPWGGSLQIPPATACTQEFWDAYFQSGGLGEIL